MECKELGWLAWIEVCEKRSRPEIVAGGQEGELYKSIGTRGGVNPGHSHWSFVGIDCEVGTGVLVD